MKFNFDSLRVQMVTIYNTIVYKYNNDNKIHTIESDLNEMRKMLVILCSLYDEIDEFKVLEIVINIPQNKGKAKDVEN